MFHRTAGAFASVVLLLASCGVNEQPSMQGNAQKSAPSARQTEIAALEARVDRIKDANDIKRLQRAYGFYVDKGKWDDVADLFAADATVEYGHDGVYVGQNRI